MTRRYHSARDAINAWGDAATDLTTATAIDYGRWHQNVVNPNQPKADIPAHLVTTKVEVGRVLEEVYEAVSRKAWLRWARSWFGKRGKDDWSDAEYKAVEVVMTEIERRMWRRGMIKVCYWYDE